MNFGSYDATVIGWPQSLISQFEEPGRFPYMALSSYKSIGPSASNIWLAPTTTIAMAPTFSTIHGRHALKMGLDYRWIRYANYQSTWAGGTLAFDDGFTRSNYLTQDSLSGNAAASALLEYAASGEVDYIARPYYQWHYIAPWVQDDIKITRRLTINVGLQWDLLLPVTEKHGLLNRGFFAEQVNPISSRIDQSAFPGCKVNGGIGFAGSGSAYNMDWRMIQPRFGAAFQLTPKTVLRRGSGLSFLNSVSTGDSYGFSQSTPYVATNDAGRTSASVVSNPFPNGVLQPTGATPGLQTPLGQGPSFADPRARLGYVHSFSFGFQRQFTSFNIQDYNVGKVWYNTLQITVQKRYRYGLTFTGSYAFSKNLQALNYLNPQDALPSRSLTPWDRPNRLTIAPIYELPFGPGKKFLGQSHGVAAHLVVGWQMVLNTTFMSGTPMTVPNGVTLLRDPSLPNPTWDQVFNTGTIQPNGTTVNQDGTLPPAFQIQSPSTLRTASQYYPNLRNLWGNEDNVSRPDQCSPADRVGPAVRVLIGTGVLNGKSIWK